MVNFFVHGKSLKRYFSLVSHRNELRLRLISVDKMNPLGLIGILTEILIDQSNNQVQTE